MNNKEYGAWGSGSAKITGRSLRVKMAPERSPGLGSHTQRAKISNPRETPDAEPSEWSPGISIFKDIPLVSLMQLIPGTMNLVHSPSSGRNWGLDDSG